jgi:hypothetical protein
MNEKTTDINEQIINLQKEIDDINSKGVPNEYERIRINQIINLIRNLHRDNRNNNIDKNNNARNLNILQNIIQPIKARNLAQFNTNKNNLVNSSVVSELYDSCFIDVINNGNDIYSYDNDYTTYANIWKKYLDGIQNKKTIDYTSFIEIMNKYQKIILTEKYDLNDKINKLQPIFTFYNTIVHKYVKNYLELPKEYNNDNDCLDVIINIIVHIVKRILLVPFYYELVANLQAFLEESLKDTNNIANADSVRIILIEILGDRHRHTATEGTKLAEYIFKYMPLKLVKKTLNIYEGDDNYDIDKDDVSVDIMFENLLKIFDLNTTVNISGDLTPLISNIKEKVFPKYKDYIKISIETMYLVLNNYLYYIYNQTIDIQIFEALNRNK